MSGDLSASTVLFRTSPAVLENLFRSIEGVVEPKSFYCIDNSPTDDLKDVCLRRGFNYRWTGQNLGYGRAHNIAILESLNAGRKYHIVLNPDLSFVPNVIPLMRSFMDSNPNIGLSMPKIVYPDGRPQNLCRLLPQPGHLFARRFLGFWRWTKDLNRYYELPLSKLSRPVEVPLVSGCFMFLRLSIVAQSGAFDDRFFMYLEDYDLCRRISGFSKVVYFPEAEAKHDYGRGSYRNPKLMMHHICSAIRYFNKWGWFIDRDRVERNKKVLKEIGLVTS